MRHTSYSFRKRSEDSPESLNNSFSNSSMTSRPKIDLKKQREIDDLNHEIEEIMKRIETVKAKKLKIEEKHALTLRQLVSLKKKDRNIFEPVLKEVKQRSKTV